MDAVVIDNLVDYHCHLDLFPDHAATIMKCEQEGVHTLTVTTTPKAWLRNRELTVKTRFIRAALGLHPQLVAERANEIQLFESYLSQTRYVGEVGLDASPSFYRSFELQKQIFERILSLCSQAGGKILSVHSVRTAKTVLDIIEKHMVPGRGRIVLHWFTGSKSEAKRAVELGCYFSINVEMLKSDRHQGMVAILPSDRLLTETDAPFCKHNGHPINPWETSIVVDMLAKTRGLTATELSKLILTNLQNLETI